MGNSVRVGKVFPVGFFCAVQPPLAWRVKLSRLNQLRSPCKPVRCAPKMLQFTHVPPSHTYVPSPEVPRRASLRPPTVASHAPLGHPRPSLTQHTPCGIPGWPSQARVGRRWPVAAAPCRRVVGGGGVGGGHGHRRQVFDVTLLGNSVRAGKAFPVGFFCAVQPPPCVAG